jgi:hypothetical protein
LAELDYSGAPARLLEIGWPANDWPDYPKEYGLTAEDIPELIRMAGDERTWEEDSESPTVFRNIHAWRALAQLEAVDAIPTLTGALRWVDEHDDDWSAEELPEALGRLGVAAIPHLRDFIADSENGIWGRIAAAVSLEKIVENSPDSAAEVAAILANVLKEYEQNDPVLNGYLISTLQDLKQPETYPIVEQAFKANRVDLSVLGDWEEFQIAVGLLEERITEKPASWHFNNPFMSAEAPTLQSSPQGKSSKQDKEKKKRKIAKQSRKKNRKKKK